LAAQDEMDVADPRTLRVIAQTPRPVEVGQLVLDENGLLQHREDDEPVRFSFTYAGASFTVDVPSEYGSPIVVRAMLGVVPYTAENSQRRWMARAILRRARLDQGRLVQDNHSRVHLEMWEEPPQPRTPVNVLATVVALLLSVRPYLRLLEAALRPVRRRRSR